VLLAALIVLLFNALGATVEYYNRPCDQPLQYYILVSFLTSRICNQTIKFLRRQTWFRGVAGQVGISFFASVPGFVVIFWGIHMVNTSQTCATTNPGLYYPMEHYIYVQACFGVPVTMMFLVGFPVILLYLSTMKDDLMPGCEAAVRKLPRVPAGSSELVDGEDGEIKECPICVESFANAEDVVRTPCQHYFHERCLRRWCRNHLDCPMCRATVGPADGEPEPEVPPV
jgi:hypothetical protein